MKYLSSTLIWFPHIQWFMLWIVLSPLIGRFQVGIRNQCHFGKHTSGRTQPNNKIDRTIGENVLIERNRKRKIV